MTPPPTTLFGDFNKITFWVLGDLESKPFKKDPKKLPEEEKLPEKMSELTVAEKPGQVQRRDSRSGRVFFALQPDDSLPDLENQRDGSDGIPDLEDQYRYGDNMKVTASRSVCIPKLHDDTHSQILCCALCVMECLFRS